MTTQPLVALDIGSTKVACVVGLPNERSSGFELLGSSLIAYPLMSEAWLGDPLMVGRTIEQALEATAVSADFHRAIVAISHPALRSERLQVSAPLGDEPMTIRTRDLQRLQQAALAQALGVDREALLIERLGCDGNGFTAVRDPRGLSATRLVGRFHIVTMPLSARRALVQAVESAGLEVAKLTYTLPFAVAGAGIDPMKHQRVLAVDMSGLSMDIGLLVDGILESLAVVPWGGFHLTTTIAKELSVTMDQAMSWSLQGIACRKSEVRAIIERSWQTLQEAIRLLLSGQPRPDGVCLTGRAALTDGFAEWMEQATGISASIARSIRTQQFSDLSRQVGLTCAIGLLEQATQSPGEVSARSPHLLNRLLDQTRTILTEYF